MINRQINDLLPNPKQIPILGDLVYFLSDHEQSIFRIDKFQLTKYTSFFQIVIFNCNFHYKNIIDTYMFIFKTIVTLFPQKRMFALSLHVQTEHPYQRQDKTRSCPVCNNLLCNKTRLKEKSNLYIMLVVNVYLYTFNKRTMHISTLASEGKVFKYFFSRTILLHFVTLQCQHLPTTFSAFYFYLLYSYRTVLVIKVQLMKYRQLSSKELEYFQNLQHQLNQQENLCKKISYTFTIKESLRDVETLIRLWVGVEALINYHTFCIK